MDKDSFGTRLRKARINAKLSQSELGRELGVTRNAVSLWESDDNMPTADKLSRIGNLTNVNVGDLIPGRAPAIVKDEILHSVGMPRDVPVRGIAVGGEDGAFVFESTTIDYVRRPERIKGIPEIYAVYVQGSSMSPWREPGSTVYVHPKQPAQIGDYVVVQTGVNGAPTAAYLKKLVRRTAKEIRLLQFNPPEEKLIPANKVLSIHRVIDWSELLGL